MYIHSKFGVIRMRERVFIRHPLKKLFFIQVYESNRNMWSIYCTKCCQLDMDKWKIKLIRWVITLLYHLWSISFFLKLVELNLSSWSKTLAKAPTELVNYKNELTQPGVKMDARSLKGQDFFFFFSKKTLLRTNFTPQ